ncbi:hypothetical protein EV368DRAFT_67380 [Lentinula lateritia]|nr:hypothetical protein EV368DRAFT_67380 [Lentinula lateritia]
MHYGLVSCSLLIFLSSPVVAVLDKRDTDPSLETLIIPLTLGNTSRYSVDIGMSPGPDQQSFSFIVTTGTGYSVVAGVGCNDCQGVSSYNANLSTTVKQLPDVQNMSLVGTNASGSLVEENCQLTQANGSAWPYPNQTLIVANTSSNLFSPGIFDVLGLGTNDGGIADTSLLPSLTTATNKWAIPCDTTMSLTLTFGPLSVPMDETTLILHNGNSCIGTIEEWSDSQADEYYLLGSSFISQLYIIFSVSGSSQGGVGFAHRNSSPKPKKLSAGQVSGIHTRRRKNSARRNCNNSA